MWAKNLLFLSVCLVGFGLLINSVDPSRTVDQRPRVAIEIGSIAQAAAKVDASFERRWREAGIVPAPAAPPLIVARRLSLALAGTIPSLEDIRHFEQLPEPEQIENWLAELLADRRSADYMAERLARAFVGVEDGPFLLYRRRRFVAWLADQLADNKPYDAVIRDLIAETGLWTDAPAVNFVTVTINPGDENKPDPNRLASRVARGMLGLRLDCAECHDHPFSDWKQTDFQGLAAFFGGTRQSLRGIRDYPGEFKVESSQTGDTSSVAPAVPFAIKCLPEDGSQRQRLAVWVTSGENHAFARATVNRAWALLFGRPLVEPIDDLPIAGPFPEPLEILSQDFVSSGFDWRRLIEVIATTRVFRLDSRLPDDVDDDDFDRYERTWALFPLTRLRPEQVVGALLQSASLATIDYESNILIRAGRAIGQREFIERYGDTGADEFYERGGTTSQRLLLMNGEIVHDKTRDNLLGAAASRIAAFAPTDESAIETAMLCTLTRRPTEDEARYFADRLNRATGNRRKDLVGDLVWTLLNGTEFSWNH